jgi:predicted secreted protein
MSEQTVTIERGTPFRIDLKANPQSGYLWYLDGDYSDVHVQLEEEKMIPLEGYNGCIQQFHMVVNEQGMKSIKFLYKRIWEDSPLKTEKINIVST